MRQHGPVENWLTDCDRLDPWVEDPFPIWDKIRSSPCPIAHAERFLGAYLPTRYCDIRDIAYAPEHFSSRPVIVRDNPPPISGGGAPPITSGPRIAARAWCCFPPSPPRRSTS